MNGKENVFQKNSDKWWNNWRKNTFSVPNDPNSFNFHPGTNFMADKLGINSIKGFIILILALMLLGVGIRLGIGYFFSFKTGSEQSISQGKVGQVVDSWINFPETRMLIVGIFAVCILGALVIWWIFYRDQ